MLPVGLSYGTTENEQIARSLDVPLLAKFRAAYERDGKSEPIVEAPKPRERRREPEAVSSPQAAPQGEAAAVIGLVHDKPVRSGQQVYARGRDLILTTLVANGAEVIADGSIHIYGALRGRALAGAQGDASARIFCHEFHAELVAIAGHYRCSKTCRTSCEASAVQVWLDGDKLVVVKL